MTLKEYFQQPYQGGESFINEVIIPIFGDDIYNDAYEEDILMDNPEYVPMAEATGISQILRLGTIDIPMNPTDVFDITVSNHVQMERNRVAIQLLVRRIMNTYSSAFMVFHYDDEEKWDWRFTFCSKQGNNADTTSSKRYTFLLGPNQSCRTATENFTALQNKHGNIELADIIRAFDVEALSKEFFAKYKEQYEKFCNYIYKNKNDRSKFGAEFSMWEEKKIRDYVKKLLGRIVFLHFLQKKGWMGVPVNKPWGEGDKQFMKNLFDKATAKQKENYLDEVLEPLFRDLDTLRTNDIAGDWCNHILPCGGRTGGGIKVPYLNGGLFESDEMDVPKSKFPAKMFDELFTFLYQYNFTIDENDPDDAEVGVDPEMLGRIFENLLEDNKDKGAFYTPKEIVQYMCRESLIAYLQTQITGSEEHNQALREFVETHDVEPIEEMSVEWEDGTEETMPSYIDRCLQEVKICDPAIGSGAFPMGLLKEIFFCRMAIEKFNNAAEIKKHIIQQNIYGVDIERGAVDIARLRFWLSLIIDEETPHALPNLDFKIMQGNSLLEQYKGVDLSDVYNPSRRQLSFAFDDESAARTLLQVNIADYYKTDNHTERTVLLDKINNAVRDLVKAKTWKNRKISNEIEALDFKNNQDFFLWHTWFSDVFETGGFDIVIGNPPYVRRTSLDDDVKVLYEDNYQSAYKQYDLYLLFIEHGLNLLAKDGHLCYINPIRFFNSDYGTMCRKFIINKHTINKVVDISQLPVFENATTYPCILLIENNKKQNYDILFYQPHNVTDLHKVLNESYIRIPDSNFRRGTDCKFILSNDSVKESLIDKINRGSIIGNLYNVARGLPNTKVHFDGISYNALKSTHVQKYYHDYDYVKIDTDHADVFKDEMIIMPRTVAALKATMKEKDIVLLDRIYYLTNKKHIDNKYVLGVLNSKLINYWFEYYYSTTKVRGNYFDLNGNQIKSIPIARASVQQQKEISKCVNAVLSAKKCDKNNDTSEIEMEIDRLVYQLYGLTDEEIAIIENN